MRMENIVNPEFSFHVCYPLFVGTEEQLLKQLQIIISGVETGAYGTATVLQVTKRDAISIPISYATSSRHMVEDRGRVG